VFTPQPRPDLRSLSLRAGENRTDVDLLIVRHDFSIRGRALDDQGRPVANAVVEADLDGIPANATSARAVSDEDGRFVLPGLAHGGYAVSAWHPDFVAPSHDGVPADTADLELQLERASTLAGRIVGVPTSPADQLMVAARRRLAAGASAAAVRHATSLRRAWDRDGAFRFDQLPAGVYDLEVQKPGGKPSATLAGVRVGPGEHRNDLRLVAAP